MRETKAYTRGTAGASATRTILKELESDLRGVLNSAEVREQYAANGLIVVGSSSAEFAAYIKSEIARWRPSSARPG